MASRLGAEKVGRGRRITMMHGFTQTRRCWGSFADQLADEFELLLVDAPGHGGSTGAVADVRGGATMWGQTAGPAIYLGYSMGGRHALRLAIDQPHLVEGLVLIGASPGIEYRHERTARLDRDLALADHLEEIGVDQFIDEWLAQPLFATLPTEASHREERRANTVDGLAHSLRHAGSGAQEPLWDRLSRIEIPVLLLVGKLDERYTTIARRMGESIGENATVCVIADTGHAVHLERPAVTALAVTDWLGPNR